MNDVEIIEKSRPSWETRWSRSRNPATRRFFASVGAARISSRPSKLLKEKLGFVYVATISGRRPGRELRDHLPLRHPRRSAQPEDPGPQVEPPRGIDLRGHPRGDPLRAGAPGHVRIWSWTISPTPGASSSPMTGRPRTIPCARTGNTSGRRRRSPEENHEIHHPDRPAAPGPQGADQPAHDHRGEVIRDADIRLGYNHRGLEKLAEEKTWLQNIYLTERICGICSHSHATCYTQGVEKLMEIEPPQPGPLPPVPRGRARTRPQPPALARRRRPRGRFRHLLHVHLAGPGSRHGHPGDDLREPRPLRHQHPGRRAPGHRRAPEEEDPRLPGHPAEPERILLPDRRHRADLRRPDRRASGSCPRRTRSTSARSARWPGPPTCPRMSARTIPTACTTRCPSRWRRPRPATSWAGSSSGSRS